MNHINSYELAHYMPGIEVKTSVSYVCGFLKYRAKYMWAAGCTRSTESTKWPSSQILNCLFNCYTIIKLGLIWSWCIKRKTITASVKHVIKTCTVSWKHISLSLCLAREVMLTPSTTGPKTNKQHRLNKQLAPSSTHEVQVGQWSHNTTNSTVTVMNFIHKKHTLPAKH